MYQSAVEEAVAEAEASGMDASAKAASIKDIDSKLVAKKKEAEEDNAKQAASTTTPTGNASGIRSFFDYYY